MRSTVLSLLLLLAPAATAQDIKHPRAPEQPLPITFTPWYCTECEAPTIAQFDTDAESAIWGNVRSDDFPKIDD